MVPRRLGGRAALALAVATALGGCLATPAPAQAGDDAALLAQPLSWNGCDGARVSLSGASRSYPSRVPEGWEQDAILAAATLNLVVLRCERIAWDGFERGPAFLLQEWRDDFQAPEACLAGDHDHRYVLESIWFSDEGLARHAAGLGLPAHVARFGFRETSADGLPVEEWSWEMENGAMATVNIPVSGSGRDSTTPDHSRIFWADGDGVASLEVRSNATTDDLDLRLGWGSLPAPMLHGRAGPSPAFASASAIPLDAAEGVADLRRFRDRSCEQPL